MDNERHTHFFGIRKGFVEYRIVESARHLLAAGGLAVEPLHTVETERIQCLHLFKISVLGVAFVIVVHQASAGIYLFRFVGLVEHVL